MTWSQELTSNMVAVSSLGGMIAMYPEPAFLNSGMAKSIDIFNCYGVPVHSIPWLHSNGSIVGMGWSYLNDNLIVVLHQGVIRNYYNFDGDFVEIDLQLDSGEAVIQAQFISKGCVVRLNTGTFVSVSNYSKPIVRALKYQPQEGDNITGWTVIPQSLHEELKLIVSVQNSITLQTSVVSSSYQETSTMAQLSFDKLAVSFNGEFLAISKDTTIAIYSLDLQHRLSVYVSDNNSPVVDIKWCGNDAVACSYKDEIKVIGPADQSLDFYYDSAPIMITDLDGLKLLTSDKLEFLSRVNDCTISTFKLGSTAASAILVDAVDQIDAHSPKVDENLTIIKDSLVEAIDDCITASTEEFDPYWQKKLLRAASFGKSNLEVYNPDYFIEICNHLRILNSIRNPEIGIFLTYLQYISLGNEKLIERLLKTKNYKVALNIANLLKIPSTSIYIHWACSQIKSSRQLTDDELLQKILTKFKKINQISFGDVSKTAFEEGRIKLSTMLINYEPLPEKQIPLLLEMEQDDTALAKAEISGDADVILYVLVTLKNKLSLADFFRLLNDRPLALGIFKEFFKDDQDLMENLYHQQDNDLKNTDNSLLSFYNSLEPVRGSSQEAIEKIALERKILVSCLKQYDQHALLSEEVKLIESQMKLLNIREKLCKDLEMDFYTNCDSLNELIVKLIGMNEIAKVNRLLSKDFKLNDKKMTYLIVDTYIAQKNFTKLYEYAKTSKSAIGYEYHFRKLVQAGELRQASLYIDMCNATYQTKFDMLMKCKDYKRAAEELFNKRDVDLLNLIFDTDNAVARRLSRGYLERLGRPRDD